MTITTRYLRVLENVHQTQSFAQMIYSFFLISFYRWLDVQIQCWAQIFFTLEGSRKYENCSIFARGFENSWTTTGQKSWTVLWSIYSRGMVCIFSFVQLDMKPSMYASNENKHIFTEWCHRQTYLNYEQSWQKLGPFLEKKVL